MDKSRYTEFLKSKISVARESGMEISAKTVSKALKPHQRDIVLWAIKGGRRAIFGQFGLGKTVISLEICRLITEYYGGKALLVVPLGVRSEFTDDAEKLLKIENPEYVRNMEEIRQSGNKLLITNYERVRDGDIDPAYFSVTVLDEAAVLRSFGSKTYQTFLDKFKGVPFKFVATATPDPNKYKELIHYAGYLEIMDTGQALTRFFQRDSTKANNLTLYPHKEQEFWLWVSSWAVFISKPSDINPAYSDDGYIMPELIIHKHRLESTKPIGKADKFGQMRLFDEAATSLKDAAAIKRESIKQRVEKAAEIVNSAPSDNFILWHDLEAERHEIKRVFPESVDIYGSMDIDEREKRVIDFKEGRTKLFATKKCLSGSGCNFQHHCHRAIFIGVDYEFNDFIQAIHRIYRFMQAETVIIDIIYMDSEDEILNALFEKWKRFNYQTEK